MTYSRLQQDNVPDWGIPTLLPDNAIAAGVTVNDLDFSNCYGIASRDYEKTTSDVVTGTVSHKFNRSLTLRNLTRYGKNYRDAVLHAAAPGDAPPPARARRIPATTRPSPQMRRTDTKYQHRDDKVTTNQTDLTRRVPHRPRPAQRRHRPRDRAATSSRPTRSPISFANGRPPVDDLLQPDSVRRLHAGVRDDRRDVGRGRQLRGAVRVRHGHVQRAVQVDLGIR